MVFSSSNFPNLINMTHKELNSEAATQTCSLEKAFWKYAANLQENIHAEVRFQ